jgi:acetyltransferase-like isoleucine patch superfamily enzyme
LEIGSNVYLGKRCTVEVDGRIGSGTLIANNVGIVGRRDHDHRQVGVPIRLAHWCGDGDGAYLRTQVDIGDDVWIGYGAVVLAPVTIGRGAIVAAGAIVTSDVAAYEIVAGNPASRIGRRFDNEQIKRHELELERLKSF